MSHLIEPPRVEPISPGELPPITTLPSTDPTLALVTAWHDDEHTGTFIFCDQRPCREIALDIRAEREGHRRVGR